MSHARIDNVVLQFSQDGTRLSVIARDLPQLAAFINRATTDTVWFRPDGECPACGSEMAMGSDETGDGIFYDDYHCEACGCDVTYQSPAEMGEYHEVVMAGKLTICVDLTDVGTDGDDE